MSTGQSLHQYVWWVYVSQFIKLYFKTQITQMIRRKGTTTTQPRKAETKRNTKNRNWHQIHSHSSMPKATASHPKPYMIIPPSFHSWLFNSFFQLSNPLVISLSPPTDFSTHWLVFFLILFPSLFPFPLSCSLIHLQAFSTVMPTCFFYSPSINTDEWHIIIIVTEHKINSFNPCP